MGHLNELIVVVSVLMTLGNAQFPGMDFLQGIMQNVNNMAMHGQAMGGAMFNEGMRRSQESRRFGPGETRFRTADGGTGFAYNSPDGSASSYSFSYGSAPTHGFVYSTGPDGTYRREW